MKRTFIFATFFSALFLIIGLMTLANYGINWDEPAHYLRGQAFLRFFLTGKKDYQDLPRLKIHYPKNFYTQIPQDLEFEDDSFFRRSIYQYDREGEKFTFRFYEKKDSGHPPLNGILASFSNDLFYQKLGILGDIESYHLFIVFISSILVFVVFLWAAEEYNLFVGFISALSLVLYPLFFAESHVNIKDPVETSFYALMIYTFYKAVVKNSWRLMIFSAFFAGLALGTKFNILFGLFSLLSWLAVYKWSIIKIFKWPFSLQLTLSLFAFPFIALFILIVSWPGLWGNVLEGLIKTFNYYKEAGYIVYQPKEYLTFFNLNTYPLQWVFFTTPLIILFFSFWGIIYSLKFGFKEKNKISLLILFWFLVPILRVSLPKMGIYGGVRQIMEYIPAMAILSGIGANYFAKQASSIMYQALRIKSSYKKNFILYTLYFILILSFIPITLKLISLHPNESIYFNPIIGGLKGAKEKKLSGWGVTLGSGVYQQGIDWLNQNAEEEARVALLKGLLSNIPRIKIRKDINFGENYWSGKEKKGEYLMEVVDYYWTRDITEEKRNYLETLIPVYQVKIEGVPILMIWKNDKEHTK